MRSHVESDAALRRVASAVVLGAAAVLTVVKLRGWMATGSVALLTSAADAVVDVLSAQSCWRLIYPQPLTAVTLGVWVAASGVAIASLLAVMQTWVVHRTGSTAIAADRTHYVADAVLNGAILAALALTSATGWERLDPTFALVISGYMTKSAQHVAVVASRQLRDHELPDEQRERIKAAATACSGARRLHDLRTRDAGDRAFVEFRLEVDGQLSVREGHEIVDAAERAVAMLFPKETQVIGHLEPAGSRQERV